MASARLAGLSLACRWPVAGHIFGTGPLGMGTQMTNVGRTVIACRRQHTGPLRGK